MLKYWVRDWLRYRGYLDVQVERAVTLAADRTRTPDVSATGKDGLRRLAVEVQLHPLPRQDAWHRTKDLTEAGFEVLWLTQHCGWVADGRLAAIGVSVALVDDALEEEGPSGVGTQGLGRPSVRPGGVRVEAREGWLSSSTGSAGELLQRSNGEGLDVFLDGFLSTPGSTRLVRDERAAGQWGWACRADWHTHHRRRARLAECELQRLRRGLAQKTRDLENLRSDGERAAEVHRRELADLHEKLRDARAELVARSAERDRARTEMARTGCRLELSKKEGSDLRAFIRALHEEVSTCWLLSKKALRSAGQRAAARSGVVPPPFDSMATGPPARQRTGDEAG